MTTLVKTNSIHRSPWQLGFLIIPLTLGCFALLAKAQAGTAEPAETGRARISETYGKLPLSFEANQGQTNPQVKFLSRGDGYSLFLTNNEAELALTKPAKASPFEAAAQRKPIEKSAAFAQKAQSAVLRMRLVGANSGAKITGQNELPGKVNYFIGNDPEKWRTNVATFAKVRYEEVYSGIDLVYYGNQRQLEYDFVVEPGADPTRIRLAFTGAKKMRLEKDGGLVVQTAVGSVRWNKPIVYQEINGQRRPVSGEYIARRHKIGFRVAAYDHTKPLVIDPTLVYSTYLGGSSADFGSGIAVDSSGAAYVVGATVSLDFPTTTGAYQTVNREPYELFITKVNAAGSALVYSTYLGGSGTDSPTGPATSGIAVDSLGNAYVTGGTTSFDFPTTPGSYQPFMRGIWDGFVTKLNTSGSMLVYSTYLGGTDADAAYAIALDSTGNAYVTGLTRSSNFPTTALGPQPTFGGDNDGFAAKLSADGSALVYSTYLGGTATDLGTAIAVDPLGNACVSGFTDSSDFPVTVGAFQPNYGGGRDTFVTKLNASGSAFIYSTYLGGSSDDAHYGGDIFGGIAADESGNAYVTGTTSSTDFPTTPGSFQPTLGGPGAVNAFVAKLNATGTGLVYSTYLGGMYGEYGNDITVNAAGEAYITGPASSPDFPTTPDALQTTGSSFVTKLNATGFGLIFSTRFGVGMYPYSLALDSTGSMYVTGYTYSTEEVVTPGAFQTVNRGDADAFVAKINPASTPAPSYSAQVQQPINPDGSSVFNVKRGVVPVKFTLSQNGTPTCALPPATIAVTRTAGGTTGQIDESVYSGSADTGSNFRINGCQYIYNLSASALGVGTYRVDIKINGQVVGSAVFQLK
jgi:Beta-propeller repeat